MAKRTSAKTAAANKKGAKTQPLRTYKTKGGAQQYGSFEDFNRQDRLAFDRLMEALDPDAQPGQDISKLAAIDDAMRAGVNSAPRPYGGQLSEKLERSYMEAARDSLRRSKNKNPTKKAKGGKVRAFKNGGAVMNGRGPKFKGQT